MAGKKKIHPSETIITFIIPICGVNERNHMKIALFKLIPLAEFLKVL